MIERSNLEKGFGILIGTIVLFFGFLGLPSNFPLPPYFKNIWFILTPILSGFLAGWFYGKGAIIAGIIVGFPALFFTTLIGFLFISQLYIFTPLAVIHMDVTVPLNKVLFIGFTIILIGVILELLTTIGAFLGEKIYSHLHS